MQAFSVEIPDKIAIEVEHLVADGWFVNKSEVMRLALLEFIRRHQFALIEQFQREDIEWRYNSTRISRNENCFQYRRQRHRNV